MGKPKGIIILGANGSGKSTLGRELALVLNFAHFDAEDYWFLKTDIPYTAIRPKEERNEMLLSNMKKYGSFVVSGDISGWGDEFITMFDLAVFLTAPKEIRMKRIENREYSRWGDRVCEGGDMYESQKIFREFASKRDVNLLEQKAFNYSCPIIRMDGTNEYKQIAAELANRFFANSAFIQPAQETDKERQARIYPVIMSAYNAEWPEWFTQERRNLERLIGIENIARISHFGSTAVPGLIAKPTVDILLEIKDAANVSELIDALSSPEYICLNPPDMPTPPPHLMFLKGYLPDGFAKKVYHIHVRYQRDSTNHAAMWDEIYFRDYLITHPDTAAEYAALKAKLHKVFEHDRDGYTDAKTAFIRAVTEKARKV